MVVQHTMSWFWDLKEHLDPENVTCDLRLSSTLGSAHFLRKSGQKMWKHFGDSVWICSCVFFTSIFAFVQEKHNMYLQVKHKKGQQSQFMKKKKGSWQPFTMLSSKYNYSLIHSCLEMHITPIMHSRYLSDFLHLQMCLLLTECLSQTGYSGLAVFQAWWCRAECTIPSDSRHVRTAGWNREISVSYYGVDWLHTSESVSHQEWGN